MLLNLQFQLSHCLYSRMWEDSIAKKLAEFGLRENIRVFKQQALSKARTSSKTLKALFLKFRNTRTLCSVIRINILCAFGDSHLTPYPLSPNARGHGRQIHSGTTLLPLILVVLMLVVQLTSELHYHYASMHNFKLQNECFKRL